MTDENELKIALGPVGAAGLLLLLLGLLRRAAALAVAGVLAVAADVGLPRLRCYAAARPR